VFLASLGLAACDSPTGGGSSASPPPGGDPAVTVHTAGQYIVGDNFKAAYWKNGTRTDPAVPEGTTSSRADSIAVSGSDVYIVGYANNSPATAWYWKNGVITSLSDTAS
jgi:hypothetical protein